MNGDVKGRPESPDPDSWIYNLFLNGTSSANDFCTNTMYTNDEKKANEMQREKRWIVVKRSKQMNEIIRNERRLHHSRGKGSE